MGRLQGEIRQNSEADRLSEAGTLPKDLGDDGALSGILPGTAPMPAFMCGRSSIIGCIDCCIDCEVDYWANQVKRCQSVNGKPINSGDGSDAARPGRDGDSHGQGKGIRFI